MLVLTPFLSLILSQEMILASSKYGIGKVSDTVKIMAILFY